MGPLRLRLEHSGLLLGVVLAGVLLGVWNAGQPGAAVRFARAGAGLLLRAAPSSGDVAAAPDAVAPALLAAPAPAPVGDPFSVVGAPTLSVATMDAILAEYGSPAQGQGAVFYQMGLKYGLDPVFALGFYVHESRCGTRGVARVTHGIGNIRWTPGFASYEGYRSYPDFAAGIEDWFKLIRSLYVDGWGLRTVAAIIPRYAPAADNNDPGAYVADVQNLALSWRGRETAGVGG